VVGPEDDAGLATSGDNGKTAIAELAISDNAQPRLIARPGRPTGQLDDDMRYWVLDKH
jgi:hypothetical protein